MQLNIQLFNKFVKHLVVSSATHASTLIQKQELEQQVRVLTSDSSVEFFPAILQLLPLTIL